jgi:hypothetical protein
VEIWRNGLVVGFLLVGFGSMLSECEVVGFFGEIDK